jgi:hypothetical protein
MKLSSLILLLYIILFVVSEKVAGIVIGCKIPLFDS